MNPYLDSLQPYPFEKLRALLEGVVPPADLPPVRLSIGEPQHATPEFIKTALTDALSGLANYPTTAGSDALRGTIARWIERRYQLPAINAATQVVPVNGSREALFAFAQCVLDGTQEGALVVSPNPFYQIYEGAALLAGAKPVFYNCTPDNRFNGDLKSIDAATWEKVQLVFVCSPGNPTGAVMSLDDWKELFALADQYNFVIASDECYSEIYFEEGHAPIGGLQAAHQLGRSDFRNLVMFSSLSKRSNVPGLRSGFVAGDATILKKFLLYRTYHGCAMNPAVQAASIAAWNDESHVEENRRMYREKFAAVTPILQDVLDVSLPEAGFYLWANVAKTGKNDLEFTREVLAQQNVAVVPGSYLAREANGHNPGANYIRIALVAPLADCVEAAKRIVAYVKSAAA